MKVKNIYQPYERKIIYIQTANNSDGMWPAYKGLEKIGDATIFDFETDNRPNSADLRKAADKRIGQYMKTAGVPYTIHWAELAYRKTDRTFFRDYDVHEVLLRSGIKKKKIGEGNEWFYTDVETAKQAIKAVKEGRSSLNTNSKIESQQRIILRPEQIDAIKQTKEVFRTKDKMLWNAKMRFGKTITALQLIKEMNFKKVLIMTHRPVVSDGWFSDFDNIFYDDSIYQIGSREIGEKLENLSKSDAPFIYFASLQDLRGSVVFGGTSADKNQLIAQIEWDFVIIDEAHEGTQTDIAEKVKTGVLRENTKLLELSGTPFNILNNYDESQVYTWDYVMEQSAKRTWSEENPALPNPYETLPKVSMYTFEMKKNFKDNSFISTEDKSFNFKEFFRLDDTGNFFYESKVNQFLNNITTPNEKTNYPYSTKEFRDELRHTLWLLPGVREAKALENLMKVHPVFGMEYKIINIVDNGDSIDGVASKGDLDRVKDAITGDPSSTKTITLTVRKLTTGVTIKPWTAVMFLSNTNSAMQYLQAAFRAQTPFTHEKLGMKANAYIFDFAPDRALKVMAESAQLSTKAGKRTTDVQKNMMKQLLNFLPILGESGNGMKEFKVDQLLTQLKKVYAEKAVRTGFDDDSIYNDELLLLNESDLADFNNLKALVGSTKADRKRIEIPINNQGLTEEEYKNAEKARKKQRRERTPEEQEAFDRINQQKKQRKVMISILRSISIRIPLMIYGLELDFDEDVDINKFVKMIDHDSWKEFMPEGVTKERFIRFSKYYDPEVFIEAGRLIRRRVKALDSLGPIERAENLARILGTFRNPDKETVLTPWRMVNMHFCKTIGGLSFYGDEYTKKSTNELNELRWVSTEYTSSLFHENSHILEINSKTGLYPLFAALSLYSVEFEKMNTKMAGKFDLRDELDLWRKILFNNIYVIAKTPMAKTITERTLSGYQEIKMNVVYLEGFINKAKQNIDSVVKEINREFVNMKFDVVIGNPPYQEEAGGTSSSDKPIYHLFMETAYQLADKVTFITPARFLFRAGGTPSAWNEKMLNDEHLKIIMYEPSSEKIFPRTDIKGGLAITLWDKNQNFGKIGTFTPYDEQKSILKKVESDLANGNLTDIIFSQNKFNLEILYADYPEVKKLISSNGKDKRLESNIFNKLSAFYEYQSKESDLKVFGIIKNNRVSRYIDSKYIDLKHPNLYKYKVLIPKSNGSGSLGETFSSPFIAVPYEGYTRTFLGIGDFETRAESEAALKYIKTKFLRIMLGVLKVTQDNNPEKWSKVPLQNFTSKSDIDWSQDIHKIDEQLYKKYELNEAEIKFIEETAQEMI